MDRSILLVKVGDDMCTCITFKTKDHYFGRNMDIECHFNENIVITPREYLFSLKNGTSFHTKYAMIGMANVISDYPLYAEATNEMGLSIAGLYFPNNAVYFNEKKEKLNITPYELIPYLLGQYQSVEEIKEMIHCINISNIPFSQSIPLSDLHFMISDEKESIVLEQTTEGFKIYDNKIGVLTNNPTFDYHQTNLCNYMNLTANAVENHFSKQLELESYAQGMGAIGLPGDTSSASRFVRVAFHKWNSVCDEDENSSITQFFHILDTVQMTKGSTITKSGNYDVTIYSCCINTNTQTYYYKTYTNNQIHAIKMNEEDKKKSTLSIFSLIRRQEIQFDH